MLLRLIETSGKRWKLIAEALGNSNPRTPAMVRNRYLRIERGRWLTEQGMSKNRCGQCGQLKRGHVCQAPRAMVNTNLEGQASRHLEARGDDHSPSSSPYTATEGYPTPGKLALGAPPLSYLSYGANDDSMPSLTSPDLVGLNGTPGRTPQSLAGIMGTAGTGGNGPPGLRPQSSFDILLRASEMRSTEAPPDQPKILADTPSVLPGDLGLNPFRSVTSEDPSTSLLTPADIAMGAPMGAPPIAAPAASVASCVATAGELALTGENFAPNATRRVEVDAA